MRVIELVCFFVICGYWLVLHDLNFSFLSSYVSLNNFCLFCLLPLLFHFSFHFDCVFEVRVCPLFYKTKIIKYMHIYFYFLFICSVWWCFEKMADREMEMKDVNWQMVVEQIKSKYTHRSKMLLDIAGKKRNM